MVNALESLRGLSDEALIACVSDCVSDERRATARLLASLGELDARRLYLPQGFHSLFAYCVGRLHLSERAAYSRIEAARLARRFPIILELVADSRVSLTAIALLARFLNEENHQALLTEATHKTVREVEHIVARLAPRPDVPQVLRRMPLPADTASSSAAATASTPAVGPVAASTEEAVAGLGRSLNVSLMSPASAGPEMRPMSTLPRTVIKPIAPERYKLQVTLSRSAHDKLRAAQNLLRHAAPGGDLGSVLERALDALLAHIEKTKLAFVAKPRRERVKAPVQAGTTEGEGGERAPATRHIPAHVRRAVWKRDGGRCAFIGAAGRCRARALLELHHVTPFAAGGEATVENIELRCRAHNAYEAEVYFR